MLINLERLVIEGLILTIPDSIFIVLFGLLFTGYKDKISVPKVLYFAVICSIIDIVGRFFLEKYGFHSIILTISGVILIFFIFRLDLIASCIIILFALFTTFILQGIYFVIMPFAFDMDISQLVNMLSSYDNIYKKIGFSYLYFGLCTIIYVLLYNNSIVFINLKKNKLLAKLKSDDKSYFEDAKFLLYIILPILILLIINFSIYYYNAFNQLKPSSFLYFMINSFGLIISNIIMVFLIKKNSQLKYYKLENETQQKYLDNVDILLRGLRHQKHGFANHLNVLQGYLLLGHYEKAKEYLAEINNIVTTTYTVIDVDNPAINALLNVKLKKAEDNNIKFTVYSPDDISEINFKVFEIGEAVGNIIDNAIEATSKYNRDKFVKIEISLDDKYLLFNIINSGKNISKDVINKIFEEGFTTKDDEIDDHGLGLYISKTIIENNKGRIEAKSDTNITTFKIYLPGMIQSEPKVS